MGRETSSAEQPRWIVEIPTSGIILVVGDSIELLEIVLCVGNCQFCNDIKYDFEH